MIAKVRNIFYNYFQSLPDKSLKKRFIKGTFWSVIATFVQQGLGLIGTVFAARILGKVGYGQLEMVQSTVGMFGVFAGLGLSLTATKYVAEYCDIDKVKTGRIISLSWLVSLVSGIIMTVIVASASGWISANTLNAPAMKTEIQLGCVVLLFSAMMGTQRGILTGLESFKCVAITSFAQGILQLIAVVVGTYFWKVRGAVIGYSLGSALGWLLTALFVKSQMAKFKLKLDFTGLLSEFAILWRFSLPAFMSTVIYSPALWAARAVLINFADDGYSQLGIYSAATRLQNLQTIIGASLGSVLLPMMASKEGKGSNVFQKSNIIISWAIGVIPALPIMFFPEIVGAVFGNDFKGDNINKTIVIVMLVTCITLYKQGLARVLIAHSLLWWGLASNICWAMLLVLFTYMFAKHGAIGLAVAFFLSYAINTIMFIPLYVIKGLVPKGTLISLPVFFIWGILFFAASTTFLGFSIPVRFVSFLVSSCLLVGLFYSIFKAK